MGESLLVKISGIRGSGNKPADLRSFRAGEGIDLEWCSG